MKTKYSTLLIIFTLLIAITCTSSKGKGGRKQPKKGPMPCPLKDC